ncbi:MFS transporter [Paenibacillus sp. JX-17]|uniref:MFS transporter n=1 Tax=Paenibacillus lacisoli TaxID=3064525 RepID=A0ABT9CD20_9BACL|nr:MFS transporter [Paenibacillus sp. JX-17]MDO7906473.1 MFS transporter [Paenibacillus sp. JX-17]
MRWLDDYPKEVKVFLGASLINAAGSALMWPLITMYIFEELGRTMSDAGLVVLVQSLGGIFGQLVGGALYHRVGVKRLIVGSLALNAAGLATLPFISGYWYVFMAMMGFIGFCNAVSMPAIQAFIGFRFAARRSELFNVVYVANNIGVALGTALSGVLAEISYHLSFILNGATSAVFAVYFFRYLSRVDREEGEVHLSKRKRSPDTPPAAALLRDTRIYLYIGMGTMFLWFGNSIWNSGVSPFIIESGMEKSMYSLLWTLNGIMIFVAQPLTTLIKRLCAKSSSAQLIASGIFYLAAYVVILGIQNYGGMVLAMILATLGEMLMSPAIPAFIADHSGKGAPFYIGLVGGIGSAGRVVGPYAMGVLYDGNGLSPVAWLAVSAAIGCVAFYVLHLVLNRSRVHEAELEYSA